MPAAGGRRGSLSSQFDHDPLPDRARRPGPATTKKTFTTKGDLMTATILQPPTIRAEAAATADAAAQARLSHRAFLMLAVLTWTGQSS